MSERRPSPVHSPCSPSSAPSRASPPHSHFGYCDEDDDPLRAALGGKYFVNRRYELALQSGSELPESTDAQ